MGMNQESGDLKNKSDKEIDRILTTQYIRGKQLLTENKDVLDAIANMLVEKEKINGDQMLELIARIKPELAKKEIVPA